MCPADSINYPRHPAIVSGDLERSLICYGTGTIPLSSAVRAAGTPSRKFEGSGNTAMTKIRSLEYTIGGIRHRSVIGHQGFVSETLAHCVFCAARNNSDGEHDSNGKQE